MFRTGYICDFTTCDKTDKLKEDYYKNIQTADDIKQLKNTVADIEKFYSSSSS